jgi:predicted PurR-regulated permease PerM
VLGIAIAVAILLEVIWIARHIITWILIAVFLALALNPAVEWFQRHGVKRGAWRPAITCSCTAGLVARSARSSFRRSSTR